MKQIKQIKKRVSILIGLLLIIIPQMLIAGEILSESGWTRLVTGDRATWLTRELDLLPVPTEVSISALTAI